MRELSPRYFYSRKKALKSVVGLTVGTGLILSTGEACGGKEQTTAAAIEATTVSRSIVDIKITDTPTAEHTVEATPTTEKVDLKIFKPDAIREKHGDVTLALDESYPNPKRCESFTVKSDCPPVVNKLSLNTEMPKEEAEKRLADFTDQIKFVAWEKLSKGLTDAQLMANYDDLYKEYKARTANGEVLEFPITAFTDKSGYRNPELTNAKSNDKVEYMYVANRIDQTNVNTSSSQYVGILRNNETGTITLAIYDTTAGGIDQPGFRRNYGAATSMGLAGIILGDKYLQETKKLTTDQDARLSSLALKLRATIAPNVTNVNLNGAVTAQR